jgi:D-alanyl-D-alanine carboxypeptidase
MRESKKTKRVKKVSIVRSRTILGVLSLVASLLSTTAQAADAQLAVVNDVGISIPAVTYRDTSYSLDLKLLPVGPPYQLEEIKKVPLQGDAPLGASSFVDNWLQIPVLEFNDEYYQASFRMIRSFPPLYESRYIDKIEKGSFNTAIGGLSYRSGRTLGITSEDGGFYYQPGEKITFSIGDYAIGAAVVGEDGLEFSTLFSGGELDTNYLAALRMLVVLDGDLNPVNGIAVDQDSVTAAKSALIALKSSGDFDSSYASLVAAIASINSDAAAVSAIDAEVAYQKLEIQTYMRSQLENKSIPGVSLSIEMKNGTTWHTAEGISNTVTKTGMTPEHRFRVGSSTKSFTGMLIMQLVDEGLLTLDQTIDEFVPGKFPNEDKITIKMLLNHTAGLFSFTNEYPGFQYDFGITFDPEPAFTDAWFYRYMGDPAFVYEDGQLIEIGARTNSAYAENNATDDAPYLMNGPGLAWNYSNTHYVLLQEIAEQVTLNSWEDEIRTRFVEPLGLTSTIVPSEGDFEIEGLHANGYINWANFESVGVAALFGYPNADIDRTNTDPAYTMASGAMVSTTVDLVKWANAVVEGDLLSSETMALYFDPFFIDNGSEAGLEMLQGLVHDVGLQVYGHRGQIAGYDASWQYRYEDKNDIVGTGTAVAVLLNRTLMTEYAADGTPTILDVNEVMLEGIFQILFGD